jgi:type IV pilus assembly protein PilN
MPRINLLPWREQQRTERKKSFAVGMIGALLGAGAVTVVGLLFMKALVDGQESRNQRLTEEIKILDKKNEEINSLEQQKQQYIARMRVIETLQRSRTEIVHIFDTFVKTIPDGTYLTSISQNGKNFKIRGVAQASGGVSAFMRSLDASQWLKDSFPDDLDGSKGTSGSQDFTVSANQVVSAADKPAPAARKNTGAK